PDSKLLLASGWGKNVPGSIARPQLCLWELATGKLLKQILLPEGGVGPVAFSPDGRLFAAATNETDRRILFWDTARGEEITAIPGMPGKVHSLAFSSDGKQMITGMDDTTALVWDIPGIR